ncbi:MAG: GntR family transcriptional regulator [Solirubrobacteraceae bacterium]
MDQPAKSRGSAITLYEKTIDFVLRLIADRGLGPGDRLPSEAEIASMAGVSMVTVRRAMGELAAAGTLQRLQGRGTFVRETRIATESTITGGLRNTLALQGRSLETRTISFAIENADAGTVANLGLRRGAEVWRLVRVRDIDGVPVLRETARIPRILAPDLDERFDPREQSLYEVLRSSYGLSEATEEQSLIARSVSRLESEDLQLSATAFVVEITGVATTATGISFDCFRMCFVPDRFVFRLRSSPKADPVGG